MKPLLSKFGVILIIGLAIFGYTGVWGEDWKLFKKTDDARFYYDKKDVTYLAPGILKVWIRQVYTKRGKMDVINLIGPRYENLSYSINSLEFNCEAKLIRFFINDPLFQEWRCPGP